MKESKSGGNDKPRHFRKPPSVECARFCRVSCECKIKYRNPAWVSRYCLFEWMPIVLWALRTSRYDRRELRNVRPWIRWNLDRSSVLNAQPRNVICLRRGFPNEFLVGLSNGPWIRIFSERRRLGRKAPIMTLKCIRIPSQKFEATEKVRMTRIQLCAGEWRIHILSEVMRMSISDRFGKAIKVRFVAWFYLLSIDLPWDAISHPRTRRTFPQTSRKAGKFKYRGIHQNESFILGVAIHILSVVSNWPKEIQKSPRFP